MSGKKHGSLSRKGMIEVQFNWVFVMIAGAMILFFFIAVVQKQRTLSEQKIAANIMTDLEAITTGAKVSRGTLQLISIPNIEIGVSCESCDCRYFVSDVSKQFKDKVIFAPTLLKGRSIISWTLDWSVAFRATNVLYLTTAQTKYYIVGDRTDPLVAEINRSIPNKINYEIVAPANAHLIMDHNFDRIRIIFMNEDGIETFDTTPFESSQLSMLDVSGQSMVRGDLHFFEYSDGALKFDHEASYLNKEMLLGAILTDSYDVYSCNVVSALRSLDYVSQIYEKRTESLASAYSGRDCGDYYTYASAPINDIITTVPDDIASILDETQDFTDFSRLASSQTSLDRWNEQIQLMSCPEVY